jgi:hypothetical protein
MDACPEIKVDQLGKRRSVDFAILVERCEERNQNAPGELLWLHFWLGALGKLRLVPVWFGAQRELRLVPV